MGWHKLPRISKGLTSGLMEVSALVVLVSMLLGTADVVGTHFFTAPVPGATEGIESLMVLIVFGTLAYAEGRGGHIRALVLYTRFPQRGQSALDLLARCMSLAFFGLMLWKAFEMAWYSLFRLEYAMGLIAIPIYPAKIALAIGVGLMVFQLVVDSVTNVLELVRREHKAPESGPE